MYPIEVVSQYAMRYDKAWKGVLHIGQFQSYQCTAKNEKSRGDPLDIKILHNVIIYLNRFKVKLLSSLTG